MGLVSEAGTVQRVVTKPLIIEAGNVAVATQPGDGSGSRQRKLEKAEISLREQLEAVGTDSVVEAQKTYA